MGQRIVGYYSFFFCVTTIVRSAGARIDHGHHGGKAVRALTDAVAMAKACGKAAEMTNRGKTGCAKRSNSYIWVPNLKNCHKSLPRFRK